MHRRRRTSLPPHFRHSRPGGLGVTPGPVPTVPEAMRGQRAERPIDVETSRPAGWGAAFAFAGALGLVALMLRGRP
jgi:hypothetical protein